LVVLRSTGPQPFVEEKNGSALTAASPVGTGGTARSTRVSVSR
jgi:hypothetical protein